MRVFATYNDLIADGRMPDADQGAAGVLIERASAHLWALLAKHRIDVDDGDEVQATNLKAVCCNMVFRALQHGKMDGVASVAQSIGSTNVSVSYRDPDGSFFLSRSDKELLGIAGSRGHRSVRAAIHAPDGSLVDGW